MVIAILCFVWLTPPDWLQRSDGFGRRPNLLAHRRAEVSPASHRFTFGNLLARMGSDSIMRLPYLLVAIGVFFLIVNVQLLWQLLASAGSVVGPAHVAGPHAAVLSPVPRRRRDSRGGHRLQARRAPPSIPTEVFGESMMLVYYGYAQPLSLRIGRGFYQDGIWADGGFCPIRDRRADVA